MLTRAASLDDLPNEILLEIIRFVGEQTHIPRKYRVLYHLSLVNRRLRLFAFPLLERCVSFPSSRRFLRVVDYWERAKGDGVYKHESFVRYALYTKSFRYGLAHFSGPYVSGSLPLAKYRQVSFTHGEIACTRALSRTLRPSSVWTPHQPRMYSRN